MGDAVYIIDPDGPGGQDPITVDCLMSLSGGGWTKLTDKVSDTILNTDEISVREYLFVRNGKWYRTPSSNLVWDWNSGKVLIGDYYYSGEESFYCGSSSEVPLYGVNCSNGGGRRWKALIYYNTGKDPANARVQLCQDLPGIFGGACKTGVDVYIRNTPNSNNHPPVIIAIPDQDMYENSLLSIPVSTIDIDGDFITLSVTGLPGFGTFTDNGDGTGLIEFSTGFGDAGDYLINVVASDGVTVTEPFTLIVNDINRNPVLAEIGNQTVNEGGSLTVELSATDPDNDVINFSSSGLPGFALLTDNSDGTATLELTPGYSDGGTYPVTVTVSDNDLNDSENFDIIVNNINREPILAGIGNQALNEGESLTVDLSASDPDNDGLSFSAIGLPPFASLTDNGDGTGTIAIEPGSGDRGSYEVSVTVTDNGDPSLSDSEPFTIVVDAIAIDVNPVSIDFGDVSIGSTAYSSFTMANTGTLTLEVTEIQSSSGLFSVFPPLNFSVEPGGSVRAVSIGFTPTAEEDFSGVISIMSNAGDPVMINVTGHGILDSDPGDIDTRDSLEFGNVEDGNTVEQILTITNVGDGLLTVSDVSTDNTVFEVSTAPGVNLPFTINPDESHNLTVRFTPPIGSAGTSYTGVLSIVSDDPDEVTKSVALSGNSIDHVDPLVNNYILGAKVYFGPEDFDLINSSNCSDVGVQVKFAPEASSADSFTIILTDQGGGFVESTSLVPSYGGGTAVFNGIDSCSLDDGIIKVEVVYNREGTDLTPFSGDLAVKYTGTLEPPVLDHIPPFTFSQTVEVCGTSRANTIVRIEGGASIVSVTLDENTTDFCLTVPLKPNTQNTLIASAIDNNDLAPVPKSVAYAKPVQVVQVDLANIVIVSTSSRPLTQDETEYLVDNGIIDLTDPSNFNVSMFTVVFTIGSFPEPITITQPVVVGATPGSVSFGSGGGGGWFEETFSPSFGSCVSGCAQIVVIKGEGGQTIPGVIIIDGRIKTLKEFFQVTLALWNITGSFNLSDMSSTINLPAGLTPIATGIGSEIPDVNLDGSVDTVLIGDIGPGETGVGQFIIRGDGIGTHNIDVDFEGFVTGGGLPEPIPVSGSAGTSVQVLGPPELDVHLRFLVNPEGPDVTYGDIFDFIVEITNTSDRPALYASLELFFGGDLVMVDAYGDPVPESNDIRSFGHIQPGETVTAAFRLLSLTEGDIIACQAIAAENITLTIDIGPDGVPCNIVNTYPANFVPLDPDAAPVVIGVNPANGQTNIPITTSVFAVMTPRSGCIVADTWTNVVTDYIDPDDPGKGLLVVSADLVSAGTFYLEELNSYGDPVRHIPVDLTVVAPPAGGTTIAVLRLGLDSPHPNSQFFLTPDTTYRATLIGGEGGVCSAASGARMVNNYMWTFNTGDGTIIPDSDGDGVPDGLDQCPDTPVDTMEGRTSYRRLFICESR